MNINKKWCMALVLFAYQLSGCPRIHGPNFMDYASSNPVDNEKLIRTKRGLICDLGLTDFIVDALRESLEEMHSLDPLSLTKEFSISRRTRLHDGTLKGLSTLTNITELKVVCIGDDVIVFSTTLRMENAEIFYRWTSKALLKLQGSVWMKAKVVDYNLEIALNTTNGMNFEVTDSLITKMEDFKLGFKGLGILNPLMKKIMKGSFKRFKVKTETSIALMLKKVMQTKLDLVAEYLNGSYLSWLL